MAIGLLFYPEPLFLLGSAGKLFGFVSELFLPSQKDDLSGWGFTAAKPPMLDLMSAESKGALIKSARLGVVPLVLVLFGEKERLGGILGGGSYSEFTFHHSVLFIALNDNSMAK